MAKYAILLFSLFFSFGCFSLYPPEVAEEVSECLTLNDSFVAAEHGHCGCVYPKAWCIMDKGVEYGTSSVCNELQEEIDSCSCGTGDDKYHPRDYCFSYVAEKLSDPGPCYQISDLTLRAECLEVAGKDYTLSFDLCDNEKDTQSCRYGVIWRSRDPSLCLEIDDTKEKNDCISDFAHSFHLSSICSMIEDSDAYGMCMDQFN